MIRHKPRSGLDQMFPLIKQRCQSTSSARAKRSAFNFVHKFVMNHADNTWFFQHGFKEIMLDTLRVDAKQISIFADETFVLEIQQIALDILRMITPSNCERFHPNDAQVFFSILQRNETSQWSAALQMISLIGDGSPESCNELLFFFSKRPSDFNRMFLVLNFFNRVKLLSSNHHNVLAQMILCMLKSPRLSGKRTNLSNSLSMCEFLLNLRRTIISWNDFIKLLVDGNENLFANFFIEILNYPLTLKEEGIYTALRTIWCFTSPSFINSLYFHTFEALFFRITQINPRGLHVLNAVFNIIRSCLLPNDSQKIELSRAKRLFTLCEHNCWIERIWNVGYYVSADVMDLFQLFSLFPSCGMEEFVMRDMTGLISSIQKKHGEKKQYYAISIFNMLKERETFILRFTQVPICKSFLPEEPFIKIAVRQVWIYRQLWKNHKAPASNINSGISDACSFICEIDPVLAYISMPRRFKAVQ